MRKHPRPWEETVQNSFPNGGQHTPFPPLFVHAIGIRLDRGHVSLVPDRQRRWTFLAQSGDFSAIPPLPYHSRAIDLLIVMPASLPSPGGLVGNPRSLLLWTINRAEGLWFKSHRVSFFFLPTFSAGSTLNCVWVKQNSKFDENRRAKVEGWAQRVINTQGDCTPGYVGTINCAS